jgi:hypothetical protein
MKMTFAERLSWICIGLACLEAAFLWAGLMGSVS